MSPNTPHEAGDDPANGNLQPHEPHTAGHDPLSNNPYSTQYWQGPAPDLDANAPTLRSSDLRRMNRRALVFIVGIVALLLILGFWLIKSATNHDPAPKPKAESLVIPEAPVPPPPVPRPPSQQPIPLMATPPLPTATRMPPAPAPVAAHASTLLERRIAAATAAGDPLAGAQGQPGAGNSASASADQASNAQPLTDPDTLMLRGTFIRCVLQTRIITDFAGFTSCIVTEPVYSFNGRRLLLPKGSKVLGKYTPQPNGSRVAVIWDRIVTPNGIDVSMASPGVDDLGGAGYEGDVNAHWASRISSALLISMLSDAFSYEAAEHGPSTTTIASGTMTQTPFQSNTAQTLQNLAGQAVRQSANRPVTVTINQGTIVDVYVAKDVDFSGVVARY